MTDHGEQETDGYESHGEAASALEEKPPDEKVKEMEKEREERLDPAHRPETAEVDNTDAELPTLEEFDELNAEDDDGAAEAGTADPTKAFRENPPSDEEVREIEEERTRRLDPDNRPENAEVDNTGDNRPDVAKS